MDETAPEAGDGLKDHKAISAWAAHPTPTSFAVGWAPRAHAVTCRCRRLKML
ncbi:hypothetical protein CPter291_4093 [Collimonas pratensis]|uniref:Uncharacterized protein n=1 Tax=Collimonas pratensis TaxID=279113 RepID=A0ABM5ZAV4_9BURK|nr:hypothetical protein CPter291_4093 [Collimonas pratensis]